MFVCVKSKHWTCLFLNLKLNTYLSMGLLTLMLRSREVNFYQVIVNLKPTIDISYLNLYTHSAHLYWSLKENIVHWYMCLQTKQLFLTMVLTIREAAFLAIPSGQSFSWWPSSIKKVMKSMNQWMIIIWQIFCLFNSVKRSLQQLSLAREKLIWNILTYLLYTITFIKENYDFDWK